MSADNDRNCDIDVYEKGVDALIPGVNAPLLAAEVFSADIRDARPKSRSWRIDDGVWSLFWFRDRSPKLELRAIGGRSAHACIELDDYGVHVEVLRCLPRQDVHVPLEVLSAFVDATTKWGER